MSSLTPAIPAAVAAATTRPKPMTSEPVLGVLDGPALRLDSGIIVRRRRVGALRVSPLELQQALQGIALLPLHEQRAVARSGVAIDLVPVAVLEQDMVGATQISEQAGRWSPTSIRVATKSPLSASGTGRMSIAEVTQHEIGHLLAVQSGQDRSEAAAEAYAAAR